MSADDRTQGGDEVGSLAEEAARLFGAVNGWVRDHGAGLGDGAADFADHASTAARDLNDHLATGAAECTVCPICRTVQAVRGLSPEVRAHLASAASSLAQAASAMLSTDPPEHGDRGPVDRIDLDQPWDD